MARSDSLVPGFSTREIIHESQDVVVYRATRETDSQPIILKLVLSYSSPSQLKRLRHEYEISRNLSSPFIQVPSELLEFDGNIALLSDDFNARSLRDELKNGPLSVLRTLEAGIAISHALEHIHFHKIIHADVKPGNILINPDTGLTRLIDFGVARHFGEASDVSDESESDQRAAGTLAYMSPEQTGRMGIDVDHRSDFYSLGVTLFECLVGRPPFVSNDSMELIHHHLAKKPPLMSTFRTDIPESLEAVVQKLLNKNLEQRYQSAFGLRKHLTEILFALKTDRTPHISVDQYDSVKELDFRGRLYGREAQIAQFSSVINSCFSDDRQLVCLSSLPGMGMSKVLDAFGDLVRDSGGYCLRLVLNESKHSKARETEQLSREVIKQLELNDSGRFAVDSETTGQKVVDWLESALHDTNPDSNSEIDVSTNLNTLGKLIEGVLERRKPVAIIVEKAHLKTDLQRTFFAHLLANPSCAGLLVVLASNPEFFATESEQSWISEVIKTGVEKHTIRLDPLSRREVKEFVCDHFGDINDVRQFLDFAMQYSGGNPSLLIEYINTLQQRSILVHSSEHESWSWDVTAPQLSETSRGNTPMLLGMLQQHMPEQHDILKIAACLGDDFIIDDLCELSGKDPQTIIGILDFAAEHGLIRSTNRIVKPIELRKTHENKIRKCKFQFNHVGLREQLYGELSDRERAYYHWKNGRRLLSRTSEESVFDSIFDILDHLNLGRRCAEDDSAKLELIEFNKMGARRAIEQSHFAVAQKYLEVATTLAQDMEDLTVQFELHLKLAQCYVLTGQFSSAEAACGDLMEAASSELERSQIAALRATILNHYGEVHAATELVRDNLPADIQARFAVPTKDIFADISALRDRVANLIIPSILERKSISAPEILATRDLMCAGLGPAFACDQDFMAQLVLELVNSSLETGLSSQSGLAFAYLGRFLATLFEDYALSYDLGQLALDCSNRWNDGQIEAQIRGVVGTSIAHWVGQVGESIQHFIQGAETGMTAGALTAAANCLEKSLLYQFLSGQNLPTLLSECDRIVRTLLAIESGAYCRMSINIRSVVKILTQKEPSQFSLDNEIFTESEFLGQFIGHGEALAEFYGLKLIANYFAGDFEGAVQASDHQLQYFDQVLGSPLEIDCQFFGLLAFIEYVVEDASSRGAELEADIISSIHEKRDSFARLASGNLSDNEWKVRLVEAEIAGLQMDFEVATNKYDQALNCAELSNNFMGMALSSELCGRFFLGYSLRRMTTVYLETAWNGYQNWGSDLKLAELRASYSNFVNFEPNAARLSALVSTDLSPTNVDDSSASGGDFDLRAVLRASQTISSEIKFDRLLKNLLQLVVKTAGAQTAFLALTRNGELRLEARCDVKNGPEVLPSTSLENSPDAPSRIMYAVAATQSVIRGGIMDIRNEYAADPYFANHRPQSMLSLPILYSGHCHGVIYLENEFIPNAFPKRRTQVITLLSSQIAISVENARVYAELEQRVEQRTGELLAAKDAAESATRAKSDFLAMMSHEIRTPLNAIVGLTGVLKDTKLNAQQRDYVDTIASSSNALLAIINSILDFSKIESGNLDLETAPFNLRRCIEEAIDLVVARAAEKSVEIIFWLEAGVPEFINGDVTRLRQIFVNLLGNAVKFTQQGEVRVWGNVKHTDDDSVELEFYVQDTGVGIPEDRKHKLFRPFSQVDASTTRRFGGTGLGLAITKRLVEAMNGRINVESQSGEGSTFYFSIHATEADANDVQPGQNNEILHDFPGKRLLVLDDSIAAKNHLTKLLGRWQVKVEAPRMQQFLETGPAKEVDAVLLDSSLSKDLGKLATKIREIVGPKVPIACAHLGPRSPASAKKYFQQFISKPIKPRQLRRLLSSIWGMARIDNVETGVFAIDQNAIKVGKLKILLAEDNIVNQKVATVILKKLGYRADIANNGQEVLDALERQHYDVILMDMQMPIMDGIEATKRVRASGNDEIYIIAMTANAMTEDRELCLQAGMNDYLSKPVEARKLKDALSKAVSN